MKIRAKAQPGQIDVTVSKLQPRSQLLEVAFETSDVRCCIRRRGDRIDVQIEAIDISRWDIYDDEWDDDDDDDDEDDFARGCE